eukprot:14376379-Alexandrium_andersonii.AAC.1
MSHRWFGGESWAPNRSAVHQSGTRSSHAESDHAYAARYVANGYVHEIHDIYGARVAWTPLPFDEPRGQL